MSFKKREFPGFSKREDKGSPQQGAPGLPAADRSRGQEHDPGVSRHEQSNALDLLRRQQERAKEDPHVAALRWIARVGSALRAARAKRSLRQDEVSAAAGITQAYLSNVETGKLVRGPTLDALYRFANAVECNCEFTLRDPVTQEVIATVTSQYVPRSTSDSTEILRDDLRFAGREFSADALDAEFSVASQGQSDAQAEEALRHLEQSIIHDKE